MTETVRSSPWIPELYARAVASAVLPGFLWGGGDQLPAKSLRLADVRFTGEQVAAYRAVCDGSGPQLPPAMLHLTGFPLALRLMTARDFPISALGMVHVANRIDVAAELDPDAGYDVTVDLAHPTERGKGTQFDAVTTARVDGAVVWREVSTYLSKGTRLPGAAPAEPRRTWPAPPDSTEDLAIDVPGDTGRRYAAVSGDRNPIHMHPLAAKMFGFPTTIVHGMWSLARCLAQIEPELPAAYSVDAAFFKPVFLPARCTLRIARDARSWSMWLVSDGSTEPRLHMAMRVDRA